MDLEHNCINCGVPLPANASFCPCCMSSQIEKRTQPSKGENPEFWLGVAAFFLTLLIAVPLVLWYIPGRQLFSDVEASVEQRIQEEQSVVQSAQMTAENPEEGVPEPKGGHLSLEITVPVVKETPPASETEVPESKEAVHQEAQPASNEGQPAQKAEASQTEAAQPPQVAGSTAGEAAASPSGTEPEIASPQVPSQTEEDTGDVLDVSCSIDYRSKDGTRCEGVEFTSLTAQKQENGVVVFTVGLRLERNFNVSVYEPPDGEWKALWEALEADRTSVVFEVDGKRLKRLQGINVELRSDDNNDEYAVLYISPRNLWTI